MDNEINKGIKYRENGEDEKAFELFRKLIEKSPNDPIINYQMAWTCDCMGKESEAVCYYEKAVQNGLEGEDLRGALLGLGSTYRCLGRYKESLKTFDRAILTYPDDRSFKVFRSMTLHNLEKYDESLGEMLIQLLETTEDENIKAYDRALRFYSDKLGETWK